MINLVQNYVYDILKNTTNIATSRLHSLCGGVYCSPYLTSCLPT